MENFIEELEKYKTKFSKGNYKHFKGKEYELLDFAINSETLEIMVIYRQLYGEFATWVRPAKMWGEKVEYEGNLVERFSKIKN